MGMERHFFKKSTPAAGLFFNYNPSSEYYAFYMYFIEFGDPGCMYGSLRKVRPKIISLPGRLTLFPALESKGRVPTLPEGSHSRFFQVFPGHFPGQFSSISRFFQVFIVACLGQKCHFPGFSRLNFSSSFPNENVLKIHKRANFSIKKITKTFKTNKVK